MTSAHLAARPQEESRKDLAQYAPALIERILAHLKQQTTAAQPSPVSFVARAPPQYSLF